MVGRIVIEQNKLVIQKNVHKILDNFRNILRHSSLADNVEVYDTDIVKILNDELFFKLN